MGKSVSILGSLGEEVGSSSGKGFSNFCYFLGFYCPSCKEALDTFNTAIVSPIYYVMFTTLTILASVIMFKDWDGQSGGTIVSEICGFIVVLSGTVMLHATKDFERCPSFRGTGPSSPTLSTRLYSGNADFLVKQDEESGSPDSNFCSRRQESY
ncbi:hypothetical protein V8G54_036942 [Vigna mungo]|uniref:Probable magnesium transporter n=1 Tax=Vigna mungo TaxID=3915 RepID=A0AAQ3RDH2_VIGMU